MSLLVATSTVADLSLYNRHDYTDPAVIRQREAFLNNHGININQTARLNVHFETNDFCRYIVVDETHKGKGMRDGAIFPADALVTTTPEVALFLPVADCIGAVMYDPRHQVLALAHLGRHSLEQHGGQKIIEYLAEHYNSTPNELQIFMTPAAGKDVYQIWKLDNKGMKEAALEQFAAAGIDPAHITDNTAETTSDPRYYSYSEFLKGNRTEDGDHAIVAMMR